MKFAMNHKGKSVDANMTKEELLDVIESLIMVNVEMSVLAIGADEFQDITDALKDVETTH